jgi:hypothetical protein
MTEKRGRRGAWPLGRKGFDGGAHRRGGGKMVAAAIILGEVAALRLVGVDRR